MNDRFPFPRPYGWFAVGRVDELPDAPVSAMRAQGTDLVLWRDDAVPGDDPGWRVFDAYCPHLGAHLGVGAQAGEVGAGVGLGEQLAPQVLAAADAGQEPLALGGRAALHERRAHHQRRDLEQAGGHGEAGLLLADDAGLVRRQAPPAVLDRPGGHAPAPVGERALPRPRRGGELGRVDEADVGGRGAVPGGVDLHPGPDLRPEGGLGRRVVCAHGGSGAPRSTD